MTYTRNHPLATETLSASQPYLFNNTNAADDIFGMDHYAFSLGSNNGYHNVITEPAYQNPIGTPSATPPDTSSATGRPFPALYSFQPSGTNLPVLQYSRGAQNPVPSPITTMQAISGGIPLGTNATVNILDFNGINRAICLAYASAFAGIGFPLQVMYLVNYKASTLATPQQVISTNAVLIFQASGTVLQLKNISTALSDVVWTLQFLRIE